MNKQIEELALKAYNNTGQGTPESLSLFMEVYSEKFAELIIKECMEVCKSRVSNSDYNTGRMHCVSDLKEHFGVDE